MQESLAPTMLQDARGAFWPLNKIDPIKLQSHQLVMDIVRSAYALREQIKHFNDKTRDDLQAHMQLAAESYGVTLGGEKGNFQLSSFDGQYKVSLSLHDIKMFNERVLLAKQQIDACLERWLSEEATHINDNVLAIVRRAFQVDRNGNFNKSKLAELKTYPIKDDEWLKAIAILRDAEESGGQRSYLLVHQRDDQGKWKQIQLDISGV
jgi:hypothetical protein